MGFLKDNYMLIKNICAKGKTCINERVMYHKKLLFIGSLYGALLDSVNPSKVQVSGLVNCVNLHASPNAMMMPVAMSSKYWGTGYITSKLRDRLLAGLSIDEAVDLIMSTCPSKLKYDTDDHMRNDISNMLKYVLR